MKRRRIKRKYERKLLRRATDVKENRAFLLAHLKQEWEMIEKTIKRDRRKQKLYDIAQQTGATLGYTLLGMAAVCGVVLVGAAAPNIFSAFGRLGKHRRYFVEDDFRKQVRYFRRRGYLKITPDDEGSMEIRVTDIGKDQVVKRALGDLRIPSQDQWDGMWRVVMFDIPERNKWARDGIRTSLKRIGFHQMQKSAFVFPYPCKPEIDFLRNLYDIGATVRFIETAILDADTDIKQFFSLS